MCHIKLDIYIYIYKQNLEKIQLKSNFASCILNYLFLEKVLFLNFGVKCGIHPSELLRTKPKSLELINIRKLIKKIKKVDNLHFLPNNILTKLFKELKKKKLRMTINNI